MKGLTAVEYDRRMHEVICAAQAAVTAGAALSEFEVQTRRGTSKGWVAQAFLKLAGRARHALVIEWAGARFVFASEGALLFRIDGRELGSDLAAAMLEVGSSTVGGVDSQKVNL